MKNATTNRAYRRRLGLRQKQNRDLYRELREHFEIMPEYTGWFWWKRMTGYVVYVLKVEGASCAAPMGSLGHVVEYPISDVCPTKFSAYRWLLHNVCDYNDLGHFIY